MALEPITRQEQIIAGKDLEPITRMEKFLKEYGGGGGASSWNELTDRPFGEVTTYGDTLTWDGNTEGLESVNFGPGVTFYKVSNTAFSLTDCANGGNMKEFRGGQEQDHGAFEGSDLVEQMPCVISDPNMQLIMSATTDIAEEGITIKKGTYFAGYEHEGSFCYLSSLTINGYNGFETKVVKQLDNKYLEPFETIGGDTLTWDGNTEGKTVLGEVFVKISDETPTLAELINGVVSVGGETVTISEDMIDNSSDNVVNVMSMIYVVSVAGANMYGEVVFPEVGIYTVLENGALSLTINGYTGFTTTKLKPEYLPDSVGGGAEPFVVDFAMDGNGNITPDKTVVEILEAFEAKKNIYGIMANGSHDYAVFGLHGINGENATFVSCASDGSEVALAVIFLSRTSSTPASMILKNL